MREFLAFRTLWSFGLIKTFYLIGAVLITLVALILMVRGAEGLLVGHALITLGNLLWRLVCESAIILFSMHDVLISIDRKLGPEDDVTPPERPPELGG